MTDIAIPVWYYIWALTVVWWLKLLFAIVVGPLMLLPILTFIVVTLAMAAISFGLWRRGWLLG
jgi:hypothetical protein